MSEVDGNAGSADEFGAGPEASRSPAGGGPSAGCRLAALLAVGALPWTILLADGVAGLVFAWGLVDPAGRAVVTLPAYLFRFTAGPAALPDRLLLWPTSALLYALAVAGALLGRVAGREDLRVTGALLALAGVEQLLFALGLGRTGLTAVPAGAVLLWAVAWWGYWPAIRGSISS